ncbi:hypothetical protein [Vibrio quintilis]|uniref:Uncharacterized protein n=1 Tax=Vibrio quintilis TaxID=1117707 RepID=A0A1M7YPT7_9VIBR|nr:hypothetical protein [Vibrio quintilis]SHO54614.1 hypothetical protein VQ7734_00328 [Vibrio quintilis]
MNLEQCWTYYVKAEELNQQGHWPEAFHLYHDFLANLPDHLQSAMAGHSTKPCQFMCMLDGFKNATIHQSEILNTLGKNEAAFQLLNQTYNYLQFMVLEPFSLRPAVHDVIVDHSETLLQHIEAFCAAQRSATWMLELEQIQRAHYHFHQLQQFSQHESFSLMN